MSNVPDHAPIDEGDGVAAWTAPDGTRHRLHTDPDEAADFMATADAIATGRKSLRVILDTTAFWLEEVTEAGLPISEAASFLHNRIEAEIEAMVGLHLADRLKDHVDQILAPYGDDDTTETP
jgi:hypothetical protein